MMRARVVLAVLAALTAASSLSAQAPGGPTACPATDTVRLGVTVEPEVIGYLERISGSVFAHAYLVSLVATGDPRHRLVGCAERFLQTPLDSVGMLAARRLTADVLIQALRTEAEAHRMESRIAPTLQQIVPAFRADSSSTALQSYGSLLQQVADGPCAGNGRTVCDVLRRVIERTRAAQEEEAAVQSARTARSRLLADAERVTRELGTAERALKAEEAHVDSLTGGLRARLAELRAQATDPTAARDTTALADSIRLVRAPLTVRQEQVDSLRRQSEAIAGDVRKLEDTTAAARTRTAWKELDTELGRLEVQVRLNAADPAVTRSAAPPAVPRSDPNLQVPRAQAISGVTELDVPPANVWMGLADFVIDRAKQELVLAYVGRIHGWMRRDSLLQAAFPQTWHLLSATAYPDTLGGPSVTATAHIPLAVWRSTLTSDYARLPVSLVGAAPRALCRDNQECAVRIERLRPLTLVSHRLIGGDGVVEILRDVPAIVIQAWPQQDELRAMAQGLNVLGAVAEAYHVQGLVADADAIQHPYVLSVGSLQLVPRRQVDAFTRLLLLRSGVTTGDSIGADALLRGVSGLMRSIEQLVQQPMPAEPNRAQAARVLRTALTAVIDAGAVGAVLTPGSQATLNRLRGEWNQLADAIEPMFTGDYGLAMAKSLELMQQVAPDRMSRNFLALSGLATGLAEARDATAMRRAFEAAAAPVGGWRAKRTHEAGRASITAYPGLGASAELVSERWARTAGVMAPIGLEYQVLNRAADATRGRESLSLGLYLPVIDLGTLVSYRIGGSPEISAAPDPSWDQLLAPGAFVTVGLPGSPFSFVAGGQLVTGLRTVTDGSSGETRREHAWRLGAGLTLDVVLFGF